MTQVWQTVMVQLLPHKQDESGLAGRDGSWRAALQGQCRKVSWALLWLNQEGMMQCLLVAPPQHIRLPAATAADNGGPVPRAGAEAGGPPDRCDKQAKQLLTA